MSRKLHEKANGVQCFTYNLFFSSGKGRGTGDKIGGGEGACSGEKISTFYWKIKLFHYFNSSCAFDDVDSS